MTRRAMTSPERAKIVDALEKNPNAAAVARKFGFGETTILTLCKREGIELEHLLTEAERTKVVELLTSNLDAFATAKQLGINHKTVRAIAKEKGIDIKAMRHAAKGRKKLPFTQWARGRGREPVLQCALYLSDDSRFCPSLNTTGTETEGPQRMRLILWCAIANGRLPKGKDHPAWRVYGGPIDPSIKRLLKRLSGLPWAEYEPHRKSASERLGLHPQTIDWFTNQDKARLADPVKQSLARRNARARARRAGKRTPISRSWQFGAVGGMLAVHSDGYPIYAQVTIAGHTARWRLAVQNRAAAETLVKPAVDARARVREAARAWRECPLGSPQASTALVALMHEQRRFRNSLLTLGAKRSKGWLEVDKTLEEPPVEDANPDRAGCTRWFVELLLKNPERPPPGRPVEKLIEESGALFRVGRHSARACYALAQKNARNWNWSTTRRPLKSAPSNILPTVSGRGRRNERRPDNPLD